MHTRSLENCKDFSYLQSSNRDTDKENKHMDTKVRRRCGMNWETGIDMYTLLTLCTEKAVAPHSSTPAWTIPRTEGPGGLQSTGSQRVRHDRATSLSLFTFLHWRRKWQPTPVFLPGESQGRGSLVGRHLWGRTESDTTEATQQQQQTLCIRQKTRERTVSHRNSPQGSVVT